MGRTYDAGKKSDMKKFQRDMKKIAAEKAQHIIQEREQAAAYSSAPIQRMQCPQCGNMNNIYSLSLLDLPICCRLCGYELIKQPDADTNGAEETKG